MSFFDDLPAQPEPPEDEPPESPWPEWHGPPPQVMGGVVPVTEAVVRDQHVFVGVRAVTAYPTGLSMSAVVAARRGELPPERWEALAAAFWDPHRRPRALAGTGGLRMGVELADGRRVAALDLLRRGVHTQPEPPVLVQHGGGTSVNPRRIDRRVDLWLWPLPDGEALSLVLQWPDLDVPFTTCRIELDVVRAAAERALPYWP